MREYVSLNGCGRKSFNINRQKDWWPNSYWATGKCLVDRLEYFSNLFIIDKCFTCECYFCKQNLAGRAARLSMINRMYRHHARARLLSMSNSDSTRAGMPNEYRLANGRGSIMIGLWGQKSLTTKLECARTDSSQCREFVAVIDGLRSRQQIVAASLINCRTWG